MFGSYVFPTYTGKYLIKIKHGQIELRLNMKITFHTHTHTHAHVRTHTHFFSLVPSHLSLTAHPGLNGNITTCFHYV